MNLRPGNLSNLFVCHSLRAGFFDVIPTIGFFPIALLSLGATRRMTTRAKEAPKRAMHVDLEPGSLLVMDYATQLHYTHGIPKTTDAVGERISLAFWVKRLRATGIYH